MNSTSLQQIAETLRFIDIRMRDTCIVADCEAERYYAITSVNPDASSGDPHTGGVPAVRAYTSQDLIHWTGPQVIFETPAGFWGDTRITGIWAPELHHYQGRWYLFATFDTNALFPEQWPQWLHWLPCVKRGTQILVGDSPFGPFTPFQAHSTLPVELMTLDGTLWVEDGVPYMVFCHEWVQIKNGTICSVQLKPDLSATVGDPVRLFDGSDGPWVRRSARHGCHVTDGPSLHLSRSGKLFMIWSSFSVGGYTVGIAISDSGKLAGPWQQQAEPLFSEDGGHGFLFTRFDGQLMMALHQPNEHGRERTRLFELEDTGETLCITAPFPGSNYRDL